MSFRANSMAALALGLLLTAGCKDRTLPAFCSMPPNAEACTPGEERPCDDGWSSQDGDRLCRAGTQKCDESGRTFGACVGQVLPAPDDCAAPTSFSCGAANQCGSISQPASSFEEAHYAQMSVDAQGNLAFVLQRRTPHDWNFFNYTIEQQAPDGTVLWSRAVSPNVLDCSPITGVTHAPDGDVIVFGSYYTEPRGCAVDLGTGSLPPASDGYFIARYAAADGAPRWVRTYPVRFGALAVDASGGIVIGGPYEGATSLGTLQLPGPGGTYVARLDPSGEPVWAQKHDASSVEAIAVDTAGTIFALGGTGTAPVGNMCFGTATLVLSALETDGTPRFDRSFGDGTSVAGTGIAVDANGQVAIIASLIDHDGLPRGPLDLDGAVVDGTAFVGVLDATQGNVVWTRSLYDWKPASVLFDAHGNVVVAGDQAGQLAVARYTHDSKLLSLTTSAAGTPPEISGVGRSADRIWITASFEAPPNHGSLGHSIASVFHADP